MHRRTFPTQVRTLADDEVEVIISTGNVVAQDGLLLDPRGCELDDYKRNPIVLWSHDPLSPIGRAEQIVVESDGLRSLTKFAPAGISRKADEIRGLVKAGIVNAASIGFDFDPADAEPIDPKNPRAGRRVSRWQLFEYSFVSVPADPDALVTAREKGNRMAEWKCGAARGLSIQDGDPDWDGSAAEAAIFEHAGGDDFDPAKARRGFLAYDASKPKERGSYKLPFVHIVDGEMVVPKSALRAASGAHGVGAADIGDAKDEAQKVLDAYKKKAGVGDDNEHGRSPRRRVRRNRRDLKPSVKIRGMYGVGQLAYILNMLGWAQEDSEIEASIEGDESKVPAMLKACLAQVGEALIAMTIEEVRELVGDDDNTDVTEGLSDDEVIIVQAARSPVVQRLLAGRFRARAAVTSSRAGKALSAANAEKLDDVADHHKRAMKHHRSAVECHEAIGEHHRAMDTACNRAKAAHTDLAEELAKGEDCDMDRCIRLANTVQRNLDAVADENTGLGDEHEEMQDCHRGVARSIRSAHRCLRDVDGFETDADNLDGDSTEVQTSGGTTDDNGTGAHTVSDFAQRQAALRRRVAALDAAD